MSDVAGVEFIIFDKRQGRAALRSVRAELADRRFDVALCMHASMRVNPLYRHLPATRRLGFDRARAKDFQWLFTNDRIPAAPGEHALDAMAGFATAIGAESTPVRWDLPIPAAARDFAEQHADADTVLLSPVSSQRLNNFRNWPLANYRQVVEHLTGGHGKRVLVTGGGSDEEHRYADGLKDLRGVESLVGKTGLKELVALYARGALVLCPDSGPVHMATAVGTPVIGLYATSNPERTGPYCHRELTVNRYPDATRQFLGKEPDALRWGQRVRHPKAMELITIDDVTGKIDDFFA